ncbi:Uncharacterised protein [Escherichia coli]|uniref:Uncharacterized protein n=1 Tax=Escherichia coli TaxID=562 RepID=A0A376WRH3_ECOLX|nr:Uncharacterised protein [Escherichia coli]
MWPFRRKYHYWLIAFVTPTGGIRHVITRYRNKRLTLARILQAAIGEGLDTNCVVLPPSYLGKMTEAQLIRNFEMSTSAQNQSIENVSIPDV